MRSAIKTWGNSLALRLPRDLAESLRVSDGSPVELTLKEGSLIVTPTRKKLKLAELLAKMPADGTHKEIDWGRPKGEEVW